MGFENTIGGCYNAKGVSQVQSGYKTIVYNSQGGREYMEVKQLLDTQGVFGTTKFHTAVHKGSANEAILAAKNAIALKPSTIVQVVDAATGEVTVYNKNNASMSTYEAIKARNAAVRGRKPSVVEQVKSGDVFQEVAPVEAYATAVMMDPTTIEGGHRVTVAFDKAGKLTVYQNGNYFVKKNAGSITGVQVQRYKDKAELERVVEAERRAGTPMFKADEVPSRG